MRQTTKFYAILLCAALGFSTSIQSCKDYDDDIDSLNKRIDAVNKSLEDLKKDFGALAFVKDVKWDESTRTLTITPATGNPVTYTIADADTKDGNTQYTLETKAEGKTVTITLKNDKGEVISAPTITMPDTPAEFDGTKLTIGEKGAILYDGEPTGATLPQVTIPGMTITEIKDAAGTVIGYTIKYGDNEPVNLKLISEKLQGLVFIPDFYYQGIKAMAANTFYYKALTLPTVNANDDFSTDKATEGKTFSLTPNLVANYHLNPSNAAVSDLKKENMFFIAEDKAYTKAGAHNVEVTDFKVNKGVLTVQAGLNKGMLKDIEKDGEVTVLALQVGTKNAEGDTLITSDYAAVKAREVKNIVLADAAKGYQATEVHFVTTAAEAIANDPQFTILWDNAKGIDVAELVATHADDADSKHISLDEKASTDKIKAYGFKYKYELIGYLAGDNKTSQSAHAAMNGSILRAQTTQNGLQQAFGAEQNRSTIGRMPLVRISLIDTAANNVVAVAYIKFKITDKEEVAPVDEVLHVANFTFNDKYTVGCTPASYNFPLNWAKVEEGIYTALNMSKEEFEGEFKLEFYTDPNLEQFTNTTINAQKVTTRLGIASRKQDNTGGEMTDVLAWEVSQAEAYNIFSAGATEAKIIVRFVRENANNTKHYVYVTLTWKPAELNVEPTGAILDDANTKFTSAWFAEDKGTPGFYEVHFNVEVPKTDATCKFEKNILDVFVGQKVLISDVDKTTYPSFTADKLVKEFVFVTPDETIVSGSDDNSYKLSVSTDGLTLNATLLDQNGKETATKDAVAVLSTTTDADATNNFVTYQDNDIAKAVLNYAGHLALGKNETLTAKVQVNVVNGCDQKLDVANNTFDVKFLRPISIEATDGSLEDAKDNGSDLALKDAMQFVDWRGFEFVPDNMNYFEYYGVETIAINVNDIMLGGKKLKDVYPAARVDYSETTTDKIASGDFGTITWHNNSTALSADITIELPVEVTYKWGTFKVPVPVVVKKTIGQ